MRYERLKNEDIEKLSFVKNVVIVGTELRSFEIIIDGENYYLESSEYAPVKVSRKAPDVIEERWIVSGSIDGFAIEAMNFKDEFEADDATKHGLVKKAVQFNVTKNCVVQK